MNPDEQENEEPRLTLSEYEQAANTITRMIYAAAILVLAMGGAAAMVIWVCK